MAMESLKINALMVVSLADMAKGEINWENELNHFLTHDECVFDLFANGFEEMENPISDDLQDKILENLSKIDTFKFTYNLDEIALNDEVSFSEYDIGVEIPMEIDVDDIISKINVNE